MRTARHRARAQVAVSVSCWTPHARTPGRSSRETLEAPSRSKCDVCVCVCVCAFAVRMCARVCACCVCVFVCVRMLCMRARMMPVCVRFPCVCLLVACARLLCACCCVYVSVMVRVRAVLGGRCLCCLR